ncbi:MAG TPA: MFS transporter [Candidatus Paceibacterota bacterium]|nr:MFS transporter [Candidatus Paceibacterota bacterium]
MPSPITSERGRIDACLRCGFRAFYSTLIFFSLHWAMVLYINSSFLEHFFETKTISMLYIVAALITMLGFFISPTLLRHTGSIRLITTFTLTEMGALVTMAFTQTPLLALIAFLVHASVTPLILFSMDMLIESMIGENESTTGSKRGIFLTIASGSLALSALVMGFMIGNVSSDFTLAYLTATILLLPFLFKLHYNFGAYQDPHYTPFKVIETLSVFWHNKDIRNVFFSNLLLQFFFAWMVIYTPVYLATEMNFNWEQIGIILFSGLIAYVLLEYVIGYLADTYFGEKEMMAIGFMVMAVSTSSFLFLPSGALLLWMVTMFMTRVGAAFVETTSESYFFKQTGGSDARTIGVFRITQPLAYILCPIAGSALLYHLDFAFTFVVVGILLVLGLFFSMALRDTK